MVKNKISKFKLDLMVDCKDKTLETSYMLHWNGAIANLPSSNYMIFQKQLIIAIKEQLDVRINNTKFIMIP